MAHTKQWTTRAGEKVRVCDMSDGHLLNTLRLLERAELVDGLRFVMLPRPNGQHAQDAFDNECATVGDRSPGDVWPIYDDMLEEAIERRLLPVGSVHAGAVG